MLYVPVTKDEELADAVEAIEAAFRGIAAQGFEPDRWQRLNLLRAVEDLRNGRYFLAEFTADHAMVPREQRSDEGLPEEMVLVDVTLDYLMVAFQRAKSLPVLQYPRLFE